MCEVYLRDVRRAVALTWWLIASPEMNFLFLGTAAHLFHPLRPAPRKYFANAFQISLHALPEPPGTLVVALSGLGFRRAEHHQVSLRCRLLFGYVFPKERIINSRIVSCTQIQLDTRFKEKPETMRFIALESALGNL